MLPREASDAERSRIERAVQYGRMQAFEEFACNPWHKPGRAEYGPAVYETSAHPTRHACHEIFERVPGRVWDIVRDGACVAQMAGLEGAKRAAEVLK